MFYVLNHKNSQQKSKIQTAVPKSWSKKLFKLKYVGSEKL